ncbi:MAG: glycosyltransferase [Planctomycetota bacterium]
MSDRVSASKCIVVPCFNEAERLDVATFRSWSSCQSDYAFLFVDDGSRDGTFSVLQSLCESMGGRGFVLKLSQNKGKAEAVRLGVLEALSKKTYGSIAYLDADLATPLDEVCRMSDLLVDRPRAEFVLGARVRLMGRRIDRRLTRHLLGRVFATVASQVLRLPVYDTQCGAKMFRSNDRVESLFKRPFLSRWVFDVELIARFRDAFPRRGDEASDSTIVEMPLREWRDVAGSKVRARHFFIAIADLLRIWRAYPRRGRRSESPTDVEVA